MLIEFYNTDELKFLIIGDIKYRDLYVKCIYVYKNIKYEHG